MLKGNLVVREDTVIKTGDPALMRVEVEKTRQAFEISRDCGLFRVPKVLDYDASKGVMVLERIADLRSLREVIRSGENIDSLLDTIGTCLSIIQRQLTLPEDMAIPLPAEFTSPVGAVFFHGDFNLENICVGPSSPPIVILDWQTTGLHGGRATYGTKYFDVMWFVNHLFGISMAKCVVCRRSARAARRFLESFFHANNLTYEADDFIPYMRRFVDAKAAHSKTNSDLTMRVLCAARYWYFRRFVASFS